jgi:hypothetical protein
MKLCRPAKVTPFAGREPGRVSKKSAARAQLRDEAGGKTHAFCRRAVRRVSKKSPQAIFSNKKGRAFSHPA